MSLLGLQELVRNATTVARLTATGEQGQNDANAEAISQVTELLQELLATHIATTPPAGNSYWQDWPMARLRRGPPPLNRYFFFYGLLDCSIQIAQCLLPSQIPEGLQQILAQLILDTGYKDFRWKTVVLSLYHAMSLS